MDHIRAKNEDIQKARLTVLGIKLTLLREGESVINGGPLTYVSDDPDETTAIIPAHFIQDTRGTEVHDLDIIDAKYLLKRVRYLQNVKDSRKGFKKEYLELLRYPKSTSKRKEITTLRKLFSLDQITKRLNWPLGRVIALYPGKEGIEKVSANKESDRLKSPEVAGPSPHAPSPVPEVSRSVKQTLCGRQTVPRQRLNL
ncbi:DUF5641 domain-containing protein [Trichonephila clavipes]|nr:DUF5641 domain-containing protein [Trichonephila clavipes]